MKVVAFGGAGAMGIAAVRKAVQIGGIDEIVIADRDDTAAALAAELDTTSVAVRARRVDVADAAAMRAVLGDVDIVMNTVGPYYRFGLGVLRAAIDTGTHYIDICDDWEPTLDMLELDADARSAGITAIIGMGASPGVSNLLAARAAAEVDSVHDVHTVWPVDPPGADYLADGATQLLRPDGKPTAAAVHWMQQLSGTVAVVRGGHLTREAPLRAIPLRLPGHRAGTAYTVGHPEPITLHRTLRPTGDATNAMVLRPSTAAYLDVLRTEIDKGRIDIARAAKLLTKPRVMNILRSLPRTARFESPGNLPPFFATVTGTKDGAPRTVLARLNTALVETDMAEATGVPLALGLSQICGGLASRPGVHPPDAIIDRDVFFAQLATHMRMDVASCLLIEQQSG